MIMMMMMMMRRLSSLRVRARPRHLQYIYIYIYCIHFYIYILYTYIYILYTFLCLYTHTYVTSCDIWTYLNSKTLCACHPEARSHLVTPLYIAAQSGHGEAVVTLLKAMADCNTCTETWDLLGSSFMLANGESPISTYRYFLNRCFWWKIRYLRKGGKSGSIGIFGIGIGPIFRETQKSGW